jgi:hypothetical protein
MVELKVRNSGTRWGVVLPKKVINRLHGYRRSEGESSIRGGFRQVRRWPGTLYRAKQVADPRWMKVFFLTNPP